MQGLRALTSPRWSDFSQKNRAFGEGIFAKKNLQLIESKMSGRATGA